MKSFVLLSIALWLAYAPGVAYAAEPLRIDRVARELGLPPDALARIRDGEIVVFEPPPSSPRELAVALTFLVRRPMQDVLAAFRSAVDTRGDPQLRALRALRGSLDDFATVVLPSEEARRYLAAGPGDELNLSEDEIETFRGLVPDGAASRASETLRRMLFARYRAYVAQGLDGIAPYARSRGVARRPADEILSACDATPLLRAHAALVWELLHSYPRGKPPDLEERFYLVTYELDGRPNFTLRHRMEVPFDGGIAALERDFYVSHGYNTSQAIAGLIEVHDGTVVFYGNRVSTDQLAGLGSSLKQAIGRSVMARQLTAMFERSRACVAEDARCPAPLEGGVPDR